jgi:hypothetical protein
MTDRVDRFTNEAVLKGMGKKFEVLRNLKRRKQEYPGHIMRKGTKYKLFLEKCRERTQLEEGNPPSLRN